MLGVHLEDPRPGPGASPAGLCQLSVGAEEQIGRNKSPPSKRKAAQDWQDYPDDALQEPLSVTTASRSPASCVRCFADRRNSRNVARTHLRRVRSEPHVVVGSRTDVALGAEGRGADDFVRDGDPDYRRCASHPQQEQHGDLPRPRCGVGGLTIGRSIALDGQQANKGSNRHDADNSSVAARSHNGGPRHQHDSSARHYGRDSHHRAHAKLAVDDDNHQAAAVDHDNHRAAAPNHDDGPEHNNHDSAATDNNDDDTWAVDHDCLDSDS